MARAKRSASGSRRRMASSAEVSRITAACPIRPTTIARGRRKRARGEAGGEAIGKGKDALCGVFGLAKALLGFEAHFHRANYFCSQALPGQLRQLAGQFVGFGVLEIKALHNSTIYRQNSENDVSCVETV